MAVRQRGSKWQADLRANGTRYRPTFESERDALLWEASARDAIKNGEPIPEPMTSQKSPEAPKDRSKRAKGNDEITLKEAFARTKVRFWDHLNSGYAEKAAHIIRELEEFFGASTKVATIDSEDVDHLIEVLIERGNANSTINHKLAILSKTLKYCASRGYITTVPRIERQKVDQGRIRYLSKEEEHAFLDLFRKWGKTDHADAMAVLVDTGMRNGELWGLEGRDVNLRDGLIHIWKNKTATPRSVPMTKRVRSILEKRLITYGQGTLFPTLDNFVFRRVWDRAKGHLKLAKDPHMVPYVCRHTCASRLVQSGVDLPVVREWLGHKTITMTMRYAHLSPSNLKAAADNLEKFA